MIINSNGVNRDTNTMRTDAEIAQIVNLLTENMLGRTLLKSFTINKSVNTVENIEVGTFDLDDNSMFEYHSIMIEFTGAWSMTASATGTAYCYLELRSDSGSSIYVGYMSADGGTTTNLNNVRLILTGSNPNRATGIYRRTFASGSMGIEFNGAFSGSLRFMPSNSPTNISVNGTVNIYGIK